jgi:hypothetical protein
MPVCILSLRMWLLRRASASESTRPCTYQQQLQPCVKLNHHRNTAEEACVLCRRSAAVASGTLHACVLPTRACSTCPPTHPLHCRPYWLLPDPTSSLCTQARPLHLVLHPCSSQPTQPAAATQATAAQVAAAAAAAANPVADCMTTSDPFDQTHEPHLHLLLLLVLLPPTAPG